MILTVELPDTTSAVSLSYIFSDDHNENMLIGNGIADSEALESGYIKCKGSEQNDTAENN